MNALCGILIQQDTTHDEKTTKQSKTTTAAVTYPHKDGIECVSSCIIFIVGEENNKRNQFKH